MGSEKEGLEVDSQSWTGLGIQVESSQASLQNEYFSLRYIRGYLTLFIPASIVLHVIEQLVDGKVAFNFLSIYRGVISNAADASPWIVALVIVIVIQKSRAILKKY